MSAREFSQLPKTAKIATVIASCNWQAILLLDHVDEHIEWHKIITFSDQRDREVIINHLNKLMPLSRIDLANLKMRAGCPPGNIDLSVLDARYLVSEIAQVGQAMVDQGLIDKVLLSVPMTFGLACEVRKYELCQEVRQRVDEFIHWRNIVRSDHDSEVLMEQVTKDNVHDVMAECVAYSRYDIIDRLISVDALYIGDLIAYFHQLDEDNAKMFKSCCSGLGVDDIIAVCSKGFVACVSLALSWKIVSDAEMLMACAYCDDDARRLVMFGMFNTTVIWKDVVKCVKNGNLRPLMRLREGPSINVAPRVAKITVDDVKEKFIKVIVPCLDGSVVPRPVIDSFYDGLVKLGIPYDTLRTASAGMMGATPKMRAINMSLSNEEWAAKYAKYVWVSLESTDKTRIKDIITGYKSQPSLGLLCHGTNVKLILNEIKDLPNFNEVANLFH